MKKLFISCPMKGRTDEAIKESMKKMHKIAEAVFGEELEPIDTYIHEEPKTKNNALFYLGESIKMLADADYFIGVYDAELEFDGCSIERVSAMRYDVPYFLIDVERIMSAEELA
jgi:hypothetical protein